MDAGAGCTHRGGAGRGAGALQLPPRVSAVHAELRPCPDHACACCLAPPLRLPPVQPPEPTLELLLNITQPLMRQTGQLRWALNNVAGQVTPACQPLLDLIYE